MYKYYKFKLTEWQFYPTIYRPWLHISPADEDGPMEAWFGFLCFQFRGICWGCDE